MFLFFRETSNWMVDSGDDDDDDDDDDDCGDKLSGF